jgi:hypothetical protein
MIPSCAGNRIDVLVWISETPTTDEVNKRFIIKITSLTTYTFKLERKAPKLQMEIGKGVLRTEGILLHPAVWGERASGEWVQVAGAQRARASAEKRPRLVP